MRRARCAVRDHGMEFRPSSMVAASRLRCCPAPTWYTICLLATICLLTTGCGGPSAPGVTTPLNDPFGSLSNQAPADKPPASAPSITTTAPGITPAQTVTPPPGPVGSTGGSTVSNDERYQQGLRRDAIERAKSDVVLTFGQRYAKITIQGVPRPAADADYYIERKLFKAAYEEYAQGAKKADAATEANRKAAEQQALAQAKNAGPFGHIGGVWYQYQQVRNDIPYPVAKGGELEAGTNVYYVGPVSNPREFGSKLSFGSIVSVNDIERSVTINSTIPSPIPDIDLEELILQHGKERMVTIRLLGFEGKSDPAMYYMEQQVSAIRSGFNEQLTSVGPKQLSNGEFVLYLAPATTTKEIAQRIRFGDVTDTDPVTRTITVQVKIPEDLPERPSPAEQMRQMHEAAMQRLPKGHRMRERDGDESDLDTVISVLTDGVSVVHQGKTMGVSEALELLSDLIVPDEKREAVGKGLVAVGEGTWAWHHRDALLKMMHEFPTPDVMEFVHSQLQANSSRLDKPLLLKFVLKHPSPEGAKAVATVMTDHWAAKDASRTLRGMGEVAEPVVLKLAMDPYLSMRVEAYDILSEIGGENAYLKLRALLPKERDKFGKERLKVAISTLEDRLGPELVAELKAKGTASPKSSTPTPTGKTPGKSSKPAKSL